MNLRYQVLIPGEPRRHGEYAGEAEARRAAEGAAKERNIDVLVLDATTGAIEYVVGDPRKVEGRWKTVTTEDGWGLQGWGFLVEETRDLDPKGVHTIVARYERGCLVGACVRGPGRWIWWATPVLENRERTLPSGSVRFREEAQAAILALRNP